MMDVNFEISILVSIAKSFLDKYLRDRADNVRQAKDLVTDALFSTYDFLRQNNGNYVSNPALAEKWFRASEAVMEIDENFGYQLRAKTQFWLDAETYIALNQQDEIIDLTDVFRELEMLRR